MSAQSTKENIQDFFYAVAGILFAGFALESFLVPNHFLDGGVTGVALLIHETYHIPITMLVILCNVPFIIMGGYLISKSFAIRTLLAVIGLALALTFGGNTDSLGRDASTTSSWSFIVIISNSVDMS